MTCVNQVKELDNHILNNTEVSATFDVNIGVRQGCVLSPFLFSFFINELAVQIERNCSHASFFRIFDTKISPILLYGAEIWGLKYFDCIEKVHLFACKTFLGVKMSTPDVMVYGECGRFPLHIFQQTRVIKYWIKLLNMSSHRLPKKCYEMMLLLHENGKQNWVSEVKNLLFSTGFHNLWYDQKVFAPSLFLNTFTQRLKDIYQQKWLGIVSLSTKCKYYSTLKTHIYTEGYLSCVNVKKFRTALSRFRCSSHDLLIEKGRFMNIKREDRLCKCCTNNAIEDEYHFLLVCPAFDTLRRKYMKEYYFVHPSIAKFSSLLTCSNEKVIQNIAIFIHKAMLSRQFFYK
ncbi:uncharacterized protein [Haliotis asinina]|uniref:uncharacterized protein n=1 Tax=Haliotis asinina TaxID=109174 RepID=UPI003531AEC0